MLGFKKLCILRIQDIFCHLRKLLSEKLIPELHAEVGQKLKNVLEKLSFPYISMTFDGWTSKNHASYLGVTGHFIDKYEFKAVHLNLIALQDMSHTAENLSKALREEVILKYPKVEFVCAVTDSAANMIATAKALKIKHMPCFAHKLQTVINRSILAMADVTDTIQNEDEDINFDVVERILHFNEDENVNDDDSTSDIVTMQSVIKKCKRITSFFNQSSPSHEKLKRELKKQSAGVLSLKQENNTRWNSTYYMLQSIQIAKDSISVVLAKIDKKDHKLEAISPSEFNVLSDILVCLEPFLEATQWLNGETYVSISIVIPTITKLLEDLNELLYPDLPDPNPTSNFEEDDENNNKGVKTALGQIFLMKLIELSKQYLLVYETRSITAFATILDPRLKEDGFTDPQNYSNQLVGLKEELKTLFKTPEPINQRPSQPLQQNNIANEKKGPNSGLRSLLLKKNMAKTTATKQPRKILSNATAEAVIHLNNYTSEQIIDIDECPLKYWENHQSRELRTLAMKYLSPPASSVPSERMFSSSGRTCTDKRTSLIHDKLNMLVMLNKNLKVFNNTHRLEYLE